VDKVLERSRHLKQALVEFVFEAEGELAESLESYVAAQSSRDSNRYDATYEQNLLIDTFATEGKVADRTPIDLFIESHPELSQKDRALLTSWKQSFLGLFAVTKILPDGFELMNWLSAKHYTVKSNAPDRLEEMARFC
jgi:hypothetical protein